MAPVVGCAATAGGWLRGAGRRRAVAPLPGRAAGDLPTLCVARSATCLARRTSGRAARGSELWLRSTGAERRPRTRRRARGDGRRSRARRQPAYRARRDRLLGRGAAPRGAGGGRGSPGLAEAAGGAAGHRPWRAATNHTRGPAIVPGLAAGPLPGAPARPAGGVRGLTPPSARQPVGTEWGGSQAATPRPDMGRKSGIPGIPGTRGVPDRSPKASHGHRRRTDLREET